MSSYLKTTEALRNMWAIEAGREGDEAVAKKIAKAGYRPVSALTVGRWRREAGISASRNNGTGEVSAPNGSVGELGAAAPVGAESANVSEEKREHPQRLPLTGKVLGRAMKSYSKLRSDVSTMKVVKDVDGTNWLVTQRKSPETFVWLEVSEGLEKFQDGAPISLQDLDADDIVSNEISDWDANIASGSSSDLYYHKVPPSVREVWEDSKQISWGEGDGTLEDLDTMFAELAGYSDMLPSKWDAHNSSSDGLRNVRVDSDGMIYHTDSRIMCRRQTPFRLKRNRLNHAAFPMPMLKDALRTAKNLYGSDWRNVPVEFGTGEEDTEIVENSEHPWVDKIEIGKERACFIKVGEPGKQLILKGTSVESGHRGYTDDCGVDFPNHESIFNLRKIHDRDTTNVGPVSVGQLRDMIKAGNKASKKESFIRLSTIDNGINVRVDMMPNNEVQEVWDQFDKINNEFAQKSDVINLSPDQERSAYLYANSVKQLIAGLPDDKRIMMSGSKSDLGDGDSKRPNNPWRLSLVSEFLDPDDSTPSWESILMGQ